MTEQTLYRIALRGHDREQKKRGDFYLSEDGVTADLESVRNFKGDVDHLAIYKADLPDLPMSAVDWLRERGLPLTHVDFLRANPPAHQRAILIETRRTLYHILTHHDDKAIQLRQQRRPNLPTNPDPQIEGKIVAFEGLVAWLEDEIQQLSKQIGPT